MRDTYLISVAQSHLFRLLCRDVGSERGRKQAMQIIIKGRQMQITPQLRQRIERKVQRLTRLADEDARVEVTVTEGQTRSAQDRYSVQIALSGNANPVRSEVSALNASTALDMVIDKIVAQLGRQKKRQVTRRVHTPSVRVLTLERSGRLSTHPSEGEEEEGIEHLNVEAAVETEENEQIWSKVMEIRSLPAQPMGDQEVIEEMETSGAEFYPFFNEETNSVNVMYRLENGGYGLLVPAV
jgi:putative sigma-54 modulation protein